MSYIIIYVIFKRNSISELDIKFLSKFSLFQFPSMH